ncbi:unnamed protein product [Lactuca virosa]|uniref:Uncharacterized protein n=1 Tax=Lactuca virosa TaxID=75947 RepID=A0AAU9MB89_9ASTR|nr:unnamed protein product [Lactuca virosa]
MGEFRSSSILKTMKRKCRVWWPAHLSPTTQPQSSTFLFGWFVTSSSSSSASVPLEVIVAFLIDEAAFSSVGSDLEGILHKINKRMPTSLQNRCGLSMLGYCSASSSSNGHLGQQSEQIISEDKENWDGFLNYITYIGMSKLFPILISTYIVIYGTPRFGSHHFSLGTQHSSDHAKKISRKPKWVEDLDQKKPVLDLDTVILATNCAAAATSFFEEQVSPHRPSHLYVLVFKFITLIWQLLAVFVASVSTSVYIVLQLLHFLISYGLESFIYVTLHNLFPHTSRNIRVRCCQILYWPIFLHTNDSRSGSCVEYAEKASQRRHSMWLSVVIDILLGNLFGLTLLTHANSACLTILTFTGDVTNNWWLISCARLMGNPAGFKLNTELAGVLGTLSLNAIQFWSTVLGSMRFLFIFLIKGLAISGVIFGITTPAASTLDLITISTTHISTLHWLISLIYSRQIQATTALWRLFRGQKWNPLRERLDSYDYTVEQHIVGSLLFTPLLLVLPTTSAFYMSFTIMYTTIGFILMIIEVAISVIHATPYTKIFLWLLRPSRFPCGIWFQIFSVDLKESVGSDVLVSSLHSYSYSLGELVKPHFSYLRSAVSRSSISSSVYGVFSGRSLSSALYKLPVAPGAGVDGKMPWMWIPLKEYWRLCYDAVFAYVKC